MICSICVATYKRPLLLNLLLQSLSSQIIDDDVQLEIIVVDNDFKGSAETICKQFRAGTKISLGYYIQPKKNISLTRNMAVRKATGEFLLFIDDDEVAKSDWIASLLKATTEYEADGVFGKVISKFENQPSEWVQKYYANSRSCSRTGTIAQGLRTGNCLLRASLFKYLDEPFDPNYGTTGGEDRHLFERLKKGGAKLINCYEAITFEFVPKERLHASWLTKRAFRTGNVHTKILIDLTAKNKLLLRPFLLVKAFGFGLVSIIITVATFHNKYSRFYWRTKLISNLGHLSAIVGYSCHTFK